MKFDLNKIDKQMMKDIDSLDDTAGNKGVVWMRDDYLSMRGMAFYGDRKTYDLLELVAGFKEEMCKDGYEFNCDKY
jgi:hypothetical protein